MPPDGIVPKFKDFSKKKVSSGYFFDKKLTFGIIVAGVIIMKKNKIKKKLVLNKRIISHLQGKELNLIKGGTLLTAETCAKCGTASCSIAINCCGPTVPKAEKDGQG